MNRKSHYLLLVVLWLLVSCAAHKDTLKQHTPPLESGSLSQDKEPEKLPIKRQIILQHAVKSVGLPYRWGGQSPEKGFDCSGLVLYTHRKAIISIPRTARSQFKNGRPVPKEKLQAADLVFFKNLKESSGFHVGIYIGDGMFIHAPGKGRNVTYDSLESPYFIDHFIGSKTYL